MEGRKINAVVVSEVRRAMLLKALEGDGVVDTFENTANDFPSTRRGGLFFSLGYSSLLIF